ncbi:hypothetical protein D3C87_1638470 [compost metagenome]
MDVAALVSACSDHSLCGPKSRPPARTPDIDDAANDRSRTGDHNVAGVVVDLNLRQGVQQQLSKDAIRFALGAAALLFLDGLHPLKYID